MIFPMQVFQSNGLQRATRPASWFVLTAVLVTAITLPGDRLDNHAERVAGQVRLTYATVVRAKHPTEFRLEILPDAGSTTFEVTVDSAFINHVRFQDVRPTPLGSRDTGGNLTFQFARRNDGQPDTVVFDVKEDVLGNRAGVMGLGAGSQVSFEQMVVPKGARAPGSCPRPRPRGLFIPYPFYFGDSYATCWWNIDRDCPSRRVSCRYPGGHGGSTNRFPGRSPDGFADCSRGITLA
jgi:hypothetical protein